MVVPVDDQAAFVEVLRDPRKNAVLLGPGNGVTMATADARAGRTGGGKTRVLDADAISVFADDPASLFRAIRSPCPLTPHEGEFARLFAVTGDKLTRRATPQD